MCFWLGGRGGTLKSRRRQEAFRIRLGVDFCRNPTSYVQARVGVDMTPLRQHKSREGNTLEWRVTGAKGDLDGSKKHGRTSSTTTTTRGTLA